MSDENWQAAFDALIVLAVRYLWGPGEMNGSHADIANLIAELKRIAPDGAIDDSNIVPIG